MTDKEIVEALVRHDERVTAQFFYRDCRALFMSVIRRVFGTQAVDYDEIISELYILLMEDEAKRLRQFNFESTLYQWLKVTAIRHCLRLKSQGRVIEDESQEPLDNSGKCGSCTEDTHAVADMEVLLGRMRNQRYALVIRLLILEDQAPEDVARQLAVNVDNLYNIKRRAIQALTEVALKDKRYYE